MRGSADRQIEKVHRRQIRDDINPVLLVHGFLDTYYMPWWTKLEGHLKGAGYKRQEIYTVSFERIPGRKVHSIEAYAEKLGRLIGRIKEKYDTNVDVIGHSMGGLDARYYVEEMGGSDKVDRLVTLCTPHKGTYSTTVSILTPAGREMLPRGSFLKDLNEEKPPENVEYTALWSSIDPAITPRCNSKLPDSFLDDNHRNVYAGPYLHLEMIWKRPVFNKYRHHLGIKEIK